MFYFGVSRSGNVMNETWHDTIINPIRIAVLFYFGDLQYWRLPGIAAEALRCGYDGPALRKLAALRNPVESDLRLEDIDSAFKEMGVDAPISKSEARLILATESAKKAINGESNIFDEATHIRIHLCEMNDPPTELRWIVNLAQQAKSAPKSKWKNLESELGRAMSDFLSSRGDLPAKSGA